MNKNDIIILLYYILDKVEDCYYKEVEKSIKKFIDKL